MVKAIITGLGAFLPEKVLSNADLEKMVDTNDEWITTRTGMKERRIASDNETVSVMGAKAAQEAIDQSGWNKEDVDTVIVATMSSDYPCPAAACIIQDQLGLSNINAFDLAAACSGFLYGLSVAKAYVESGMYKKIVVIASEKVSSMIDYEDRGTCILFGDGACAATVGRSDADNKGLNLSIESISLGADGKQKDLLIVKGGGSKIPFSKQVLEEKLHFLTMSGKEVFKHAVRRMDGAIQKVLEDTELTEEDVSYLVPHQANIRIIEALGKRLKLPEEKVHTTIARYGNTSASSVGIALHDLFLKKDVTKGEILMLVAFGAGLTWGATLLKKGD